MLRFLSVRHLAVIDHLEVEFEPGLNVLTGETGAGKSVLVEAIDLLRRRPRERRPRAHRRRRSRPCRPSSSAPDGREVIVRREISAQGRSRAFIDDTLATSSALRDLGAGLLDLHGQHEHQALLDPAEHLDLLDAFADLQDDASPASPRDSTRGASAVAALERTRLDEREKRARIEIATFQLQEIDKRRAGDRRRRAARRRAIAARQRRSAQPARRTRRTRRSTRAKPPRWRRSALVWKRVADLAGLDARFAPYRRAARRRSSRGSTTSRSFFAVVRRESRRVARAACRPSKTGSRRSSASRRSTARRSPTCSRGRRRSRDELAALDASDERVAALARARAGRARGVSDRRAARLDGAPRGRRAELGRALEAALAELAMPKSRVDVRVTDRSSEPDRWTAAGVDDVEFFCSPNPGEELRPLARIASGGELSRIMLALRTLGRARGRRPHAHLRRSRRRHRRRGGRRRRRAPAGARRDAFRSSASRILPQIAARADAHFSITKHVRGGRTTTALARLDDAGREEEIARMIAGAAVSPKVLASAREMLATRRRTAPRSEAKAKGESESASKAKGRRGA